MGYSQKSQPRRKLIALDACNRKVKNPKSITKLPPQETRDGRGT